MISDSHQPSDSKDVEVRRVVDRLCDEIETQWASGQAPDTVTIANDLDRDTAICFLQEIIPLEFSLQDLSIHNLRSRYERLLPGYRATLDRIFDEMQDHVATHLTDMSTRLVNRSKTLSVQDFVGKKIGPYLIEKRLGGGGFGVVYLSRDPYLPRDVVIKVPILGKIADRTEVESFLDEARNAVLLDHPNILKVLHVGVDSGMPYIVQEYIEGGDLSRALQKQAFEVKKSVEFTAKIAEAIGCAHEANLIHRDLKPANILINKNEEPVIADFGLSLHKPQIRGRQGDTVGTIRFMSPEQVRGEAHRLDGRTDIWSVGVILYFMLTEKYPFDGDDFEQISNAIVFQRPISLRDINRHISPELERVCLRCLAPRVKERYSTAFDLAKDLNSCLQPAPNSLRQHAAKTETPRLVAKGLSAFECTDHESFLDLLPGVKNQHGIPESLCFWKDRIEDPDRGMMVGLLFGPSGCGKSSILKAGLLPLLDPSIIVLNIESTQDDTEVRLLKALRHAIPLLPTDLSLPQAFFEIRNGNFLPSYQRILVVFDQFEQWLHANIVDEHSQLIHALRQSDGKRLQTLVLVRDDFWLGVSRFFQQLELDLVERENFATIDLFSRQHARNVLIKFGQSYGCLPLNSTDFSDSQNLFLDKAIDILAENDSVKCIQVALFAQIFKQKPWEIETLKRFGSAKHVGIEFLEQTLGESTSNPKYRFHREPMIAVLEALLPSAGVDIKGKFQSKQELADATGLTNDGDTFETVIVMLDNELRLITPTEPDAGTSNSDTNASFYQLTHDYLVPSIREWIETIRGQSIQGRSLMKLTELSERWRHTKDRRFLPGLLEFMSMVWHVPRRQVSQNGRELLNRAAWFYGSRIFLVIGLVCLAIGLVVRQHRQAMASQLINAKPAELAVLVDDITMAKKSYAGIIRRRMADNEFDLGKIERARILLAMLGQAGDNDIRDLVDSISGIDADESQNLFQGLANHALLTRPLIREKLANNEKLAERLRLSIFAMFLDPAKPIDLLHVDFDPTSRSELIYEFREWHGDLSLCLDLLSSNRTDEELYGLCLMLGQLSKHEFDAVTYGKLLAQINTLYCDSESSAVHGAAGWVLKQWNEALPALPWHDLKDEPQWWVNELGMTMVRIEPGIVPNQRQFLPIHLRDEIHEPFYIGAKEVTHQLFAQFLSDTSADRPTNLLLPKNSNPDQAVCGLAIEDAVQFCNWLSIRSGLVPAYQDCGEDLEFKRARIDGNYRSAENVTDVLPKISYWRLQIDADGYRLPTRQEWEMTARANRFDSVSYFCRDLYFRGYENYVWCSANSENRIHSVGSKFPNPIGVFDILGNAGEYSCYHPSRKFETTKRSNLIYLWLYGGDFTLNTNSCQIFEPSVATYGRIPVYNGVRKRAAGFRVVRPVRN